MKQKNTFYVVQDWMLDLNLDLTETVVLAIINGFSQDGDSTFRGSWAYLQRYAKCSRRTVARCLKRLVDLGYVKKRDVFQGGVKFCEYLVDTGSVTVTPVVPNLQKVVPERHGGGVTLAPNNIIDNAKDKSLANRDNSAPARAFDFKNSLIEMGVTEQHAADWLAVRKAKRMTNTRTAFDRLKGQIEKACKQYACTADDCVAFAASKDWGGFDAAWEQIKDIKSTQSDEDYIRAYFAREEAKFKGGVHF